MEIINRLRQFRVTGYAVFDFAAAFLGIFLLSPLLSKSSGKAGLGIPERNWLYLTLPIGIVTHLVIGKITPLTKKFIDPADHYAVKLVVIAFLALGLRNIKRAAGTPDNS